MRYVALRESLSGHLADAPARRIERVLGVDLAAGLESVSSELRSAARYIQRAAPGILQGAATGFAAGGPAGAVLGAVGGGLAGAGAGTGGVAVNAANAAAAPSQPVANPAALELLLTLLRPEVVEALIALALGGRGARTVSIAGMPVPVGAIPELVRSLAEQASATWSTESTRVRPDARASLPRYLAVAARRGEDVGAPHVRANALRALVHEAWGDDAEGAWDDELAKWADEIDEEAERRDLADIYRLGGFDP
jgi:hypothetical protein